MKRNRVTSIRYGLRLRFTIFFSLFSLFHIAAQDYSEFEELYPGCIDNQESKIYGGTYGKMEQGLNLPEFPHGGDVELSRYVFNNMEYPEVIESYGPSPDGKDSIPILSKGIVAIQVVVDRCGKATRAEVIQSVNDAYDTEALRIMEGLPTFKPGDLDGERVKVALIIPVYFTRTKMPPPPESEYGDYWGDGDDSSSWSDDSSEEEETPRGGGGKYDNVQWDDSW